MVFIGSTPSSLGYSTLKIHRINEGLIWVASRIVSTGRIIVLGLVETGPIPLPRNDGGPASPSILPITTAESRAQPTAACSAAPHTPGFKRGSSDADVPSRKAIVSGHRCRMHTGRQVDRLADGWPRSLLATAVLRAFGMPRTPVHRAAYRGRAMGAVRLTAAEDVAGRLRAEHVAVPGGHLNHRHLPEDVEAVVRYAQRSIAGRYSRRGSRKGQIGKLMAPSSPRLHDHAVDAAGHHTPLLPGKMDAAARPAPAVRAQVGHAGCIRGHNRDEVVALHMRDKRLRQILEADFIRRDGDHVHAELLARRDDIRERAALAGDPAGGGDDRSGVGQP
jgi:hypothetical protein